MGTILRAELRGTKCYVAWLAARTGRSSFLSAPLKVVRTSLLLSSRQKLNRTSVAVCGATGAEMTPCAGVRSLLRRPPLGCERSVEGVGGPRRASSSSGARRGHYQKREDMESCPSRQPSDDRFPVSLSAIAAASSSREGGTQPRSTRLPKLLVLPCRAPS